MMGAKDISKEKEDAYLTVYLALTFGIVLSLLLALIEGAAVSAARVQAELVADLGLDSVFAEYNRELLDQYGLFFIDSSYGTGNGGIGMVEAHLADHMSYNMDPEKDRSLPGNTLLKLRAPYLEIEEASYASDDGCMVWKAQAVAYMKAVYGGDMVSSVQAHMDTVRARGLCEEDVVGGLAQQKGAFESALVQKEIVEFGAESEEGYSYQKVSGIFNELAGGGLLSAVLPAGSSISGAVVTGGPYFSSRMQNGTVNKGTGLHKGMDRPDSIADELIYGEYLMKMCGCYAQPKESGLLRYQIEYILFGYDSDAANLRSSAEMLFALRGAADMIGICTDTGKRAEAGTAAAVICTLLCVPELTDALTMLILSVWALAEAAADVRSLMDGGRVPLLKDSGEWATSLSGLFWGIEPKPVKGTSGLSYQDHMRIFLGFMDKGEKVARSLDIVEMDIRQTPGNDGFRIDRCIDHLQVNFGFEDAAGHDLVFRRRMCYE